MTRRRRPLIYEEVSDRQRRQVSTGRGQANARPVRLFPTKPVRAAASADGAFTQRYVKLSTASSTTFGNELAVPFTTETSHGSPIDFRGGTAVPTNSPNVSITQPYSVHVVVLVSSVPTDLCVELRGNFPPVAGQFDKVGSSFWRAQYNAVVVPDVTLLSYLQVVGKGTGADVTCTAAELWIYPLR